MAPHPMSPISPYLVVSDAKGAAEWYRKAFGAKELQRQEAQDGKRLMHVAMKVNRGVFMFCDDFPEHRGGVSSTPQALGGSPVTLHLELKRAEQVDKLVAKAKKLGATVTSEPADMFWGDRYAQLKDPYGHNWSIGAPKADAPAIPTTLP
jgi:PhnB protein